MIYSLLGGQRRIPHDVSKFLRAKARPVESNPPCDDFSQRFQGERGTPIQIGDLSKRTGVSIRSLRYYEEKNVLTPSRSDNGYRRYHEEHVERVMQIQLYLGLGLKVEEIANILDGVPIEQKKEHCREHAISLYEQKLSEVQKQISRLNRREQELKEMLDYWKR